MTAPLDIPPGEKPRWCTFQHIGGAREQHFCALDPDTDQVLVTWGIAGTYKIALESGRVIGARKWKLTRRDLAFFRRESTRWQKRRARLCLLGKTG